MKSPDFQPGVIGLSPESDKRNLNFLLEKLALLQLHDNFGYKLEDSPESPVTQQVVLKASYMSWYQQAEISPEEKLVLLLNQRPNSSLASAAVTAIENPDEFAFRAFKRPFRTKEHYRLLGLDYDTAVIDENLATEGAEVSLLLTTEPGFNFSLGNTMALSYFRPVCFFHSENIPPRLIRSAILNSTASSYLTIYYRKGIQPLGYYFVGQIIDGEALARKRIATIRVDWQLPKGIRLPRKFGI